MWSVVSYAPVPVTEFREPFEHVSQKKQDNHTLISWDHKIFREFLATGHEPRDTKFAKSQP